MKTNKLNITGVTLAALFCATSVGGLATVTAQWKGVQTVEEYYGAPLHSSATEQYPILWIAVGVTLALIAIFYAYKRLKN